MNPHCRNRAIAIALYLSLAFAPRHAPAAEESRTSPHGSFEAACDNCHNAASWQVNPATVRFDHDATKFPLIGQHRQVSCRSCHTKLKFDQLGSGCATCHQDVHSGQFGVSCADCHTPDRWIDLDKLRQNHDRTRLPLMGTHRSLDCSRCHAGGKYVNTPTACEVCHIESWRNTTLPNHQTVGMGIECQQCHSSAEGWNATHFAHSQSFPLSGGHRIYRCETCHTGGIGALSTVCLSCHEDNYRATTNPSHVIAGFGTECLNCHTTNGWRPSTFNHATSGFPLTGAHSRIDCASCHVGGVFGGLPENCYGCHRGQYEGTVNPNHLEFRFATNCESCHTTNGWRPATFNHNQWFPIYSGSHRGKWTTCLDCHSDVVDYTIFTCTTCHDKSGTDRHHREVSNYRYESSSCYRCHPTGVGDD